jgi:hypothetical protein
MTSFGSILYGYNRSFSLNLDWLFLANQTEFSNFQFLSQDVSIKSLRAVVGILNQGYKQFRKLCS